MNLGISRAFKDMVYFPRVGLGVWRVWNRNFLYFRRYFLESIVWSFVEPLLYVVAFGYGLGFFVGSIDGIPYMDFFAPAILAITTMQTSTFEATYSSFTKLKVQKTFETIVITPISMEEIVMGEILWAATKSFIGVLGVVAVFIVLGVIKTWAFLFAIPVLMLLSLAFSAMAMVVTAYARDYDSFTYYFTLVVTPMSLLSGTFFPLTNFPVWAKAIAQVLPLSHGVRVTRAIFLGNWDPIYFASVGFLIVIFVACTNWSMSRIKRRLIY